MKINGKIEKQNGIDVFIPEDKTCVFGLGDEIVINGVTIGKVEQPIEIKKD